MRFRSASREHDFIARTVFSKCDFDHLHTAKMRPRIVICYKARYRVVAEFQVILSLKSKPRRSHSSARRVNNGLPAGGPIVVIGHGDIADAEWSTVTVST